VTYAVLALTAAALVLPGRWLVRPYDALGRRRSREPTQPEAAAADTSGTT